MEYNKHITTIDLRSIDKNMSRDANISTVIYKIILNDGNVGYYTCGELWANFLGYPTYNSGGYRKDVKILKTCGVIVDEKIRLTQIMGDYKSFLAIDNAEQLKWFKLTRLTLDEEESTKFERTESKDGKEEVRL